MDIEKILQNMSLKEKIAQLNQLYIRDDNYEEVKKAVEENCIGSVILANSSTAGNSEQDVLGLDRVNELQKISVEKHNIPLIFGRDIIHGHHISLPIPLGLAATFNPEIVREGYADIADEAHNDGVHWSFAPMLDVSRDARWGRIIESPGEDPFLGGKMAEAVVKGFQGDGDIMNIAACAKHYIGYGASEGGRDYHKTEISAYSIQNYYLAAFRAAVDAGVATVMNSFNEISGEPTASSRYLLTDVLRGQLGFEGFVISDWGSVVQLINQGVAEDRKKAAELALNAGIDMDMVDLCYLDHLEELVAEGKVSVETVDEAVRRILKVKEKLNLFAEPYFTAVDYDIEKHREITRKIEEEAIVLLKNDGILPLKKDVKLCIMGDFIHDRRNVLGSWSLDCDTRETVTIYDGIKSKCRDISANELTDETEIVECDDCDAVVVVLGEDWRLTGEASCIANTEIDERHKMIIERAKSTGKKIIGIMAFGRPRALENYSEDFDALLYAWHGGSQIGNAIANIMFGEVSPSGRLPVTIPRTTGQIPIYYNSPPSARDSHGYYESESHYNDVESTPAYRFGYGLSYAEFEYSDISANKAKISLDALKGGEIIEVKIKVKNRSDITAKETVQCYIRDCFSAYTRPIRELKGFEKAEFKGGEEKEISFKIGFNELSYYTPSGEQIAEAGEFKIYIGKDSAAEDFVTIEVV